MRSLRRGPSSLCRNLITLFGIAIVFQLTRLLTSEIGLTPAGSSSGQTGNPVHKLYVRVMPGPSSDKNKKHKIHRFYKAEGFGTQMFSKDVTFVTHCTIDRKG
jgi:hypothetical protein